MEEFKVFVEKFKTLILITVGIILIFILLLSKLVPEVVTLGKMNCDYNKSAKELSNKKEMLHKLQIEEQENSKNNVNKMVKEFFKPLEPVTDTESAIANEFAEILTIMRENSVKAYSIEYTYDPEDDHFVKNLSNKYYVAQTDIRMIADYNHFGNFLKELYRHEHFLDIVEIKIAPYNNNKKILIMDLKLKLYAQKS